MFRIHFVHNFLANFFTEQTTLQDFGELSVSKDDNVSKGDDLLSLMDTLDSD